MYDQSFQRTISAELGREPKGNVVDPIAGSSECTADVKPDVHVKDEPVTKTPRKQKAVNSPTKPGKRSPVKKESLKSNSAQKEGYNPTTKAMAYDWVMKALDNMNSSPGLKKDLAEELGVKPGNLINSWNNNWKKRVEKVLHDEFRGAT